MSVAMAPALIARMAFKVPVIGWMAKDAVHGAPDAKYYFVANMAALLFFAVYIYGYAALIIYALTAAFLTLSSIVILTAADLFEQGRNKPDKKQAQKRSQLSLRKQDGDHV